jgi:hypothetical protein
MLIELENYGTAIMGIAFVKLLQRRLPNADAIEPQIREVVAWIRDHSLTDEEKREVRDAGLID